MHKEQTEQSKTRKTAEFRFSVIGNLLASPPDRGKLKKELKQLGSRSWIHPTKGSAYHFHYGSIERWYYAAKASPDDPVSALMKMKSRVEGRPKTVSDTLEKVIAAQYEEHKDWSYQLHYDNLCALAEKDESLTVTSYSTIRRYMLDKGMRRQKSIRRYSIAQIAADQHIEKVEIRSYSHEHVGALYHLDFHHAKFSVLDSTGKWRTPLCFAMLDDCSRVCCHAQWYFSEDTDHLVHGVMQGFLKRGLCRSLMTDNGSAMISEEFTHGLKQLGILHNRTLPYSAYQNGKQERFWGVLEGRLMKMLPPKNSITLKFLNDATCAWVEQEYHRKFHNEIGSTPIDKYLDTSSVLRKSPSFEELKSAFRMRSSRRQRLSDGSISINNTRFEIPACYRHLSTIYVHFARWDLSYVHVADFTTDKALIQIYPVDLIANAYSQRKSIEMALAENETLGKQTSSEPKMAPLLQKYMDELDASGFPSPYLTKDE